MKKTLIICTALLILLSVFVSACGKEQPETETGYTPFCKLRETKSAETLPFAEGPYKLTVDGTVYDFSAEDCTLHNWFDTCGKASGYTLLQGDIFSADGKSKLFMAGKSVETRIASGSEFSMVSVDTIDQTGLSIPLKTDSQQFTYDQGNGVYIAYMFSGEEVTALYEFILCPYEENALQSSQLHDFDNDDKIESYWTEGRWLIAEYGPDNWRGLTRDIVEALYIDLAVG